MPYRVHDAALLPLGRTGTMLRHVSDQPRDIPGVIAPPPLLMAAAMALGFGLGYAWPIPFGPIGLRHGAAGGLGTAGIVLLLASAWRFWRAGTALEPWHPSTALVVAGPYRFSRNPIYVGFVLVYLAVAFFVNEGWLLVTLAPGLAALRYGVIAREERYLEAKFGDDYRRYKARVRRWL